MKLLLTGAYNYSNEQIGYIKSLGHQVVFVQDERAKLSIDVDDIDGVICNSLFFYNDIKSFKSLKYIQLLSAGLDRVPLEYIMNSGIKLYNARGVYSIPISEFVLRGVLDLYKKSFDFYNKQKNHNWEKDRFIPELYGKNVLIVGTGSIGSEIAKRFKAFDTFVVGVDRSGKDKEYFDNIVCVDNLDQQIKLADIIVLALPFTDENIEFFNMPKFKIMKSNAIFVNIARGKLVNQNDLISAIKTNQIGGAVIDVFSNEPLNKSDSIWDLDNVIITPHNSFVGENNQKRMFDVIIKNLKRK